MLRASQPRTILGHELCETIGEGAHGKVKLAIDPASRQAVAVKIIKKRSGQEGARDLAILQKEIKIHSAVQHENIITLLNAAEDDACVYIVMEYAAAGELFDRIEPDVGVEEELAHMYFIQLLAGVEYLHGRGISHRDLKPEKLQNILLDQYGNLKISDFGLATVFKHKGTRRILTTPCGTPPYVAPEIHAMSYHGDAVDIWAVGIILYVLLAGNTPWAEPTKHDDEFMFFLRNYAQGLPYAPWTGFSKDTLSLLMGILHVDAISRYNMEDIKENPWVKRPNTLLTDGKCNDPARLAERMMSTMLSRANEMMEASQMISYSQPSDMRPDAYSNGSSVFDDRSGFISFSQPQRMESETHTQNTQLESGGFLDLFPSDRITRFYSSADPDTISKMLNRTLQNFLVPHKIHPVSRKIVFTTVDRRKCPLHGEISIQRLGTDLQLVAFRKSKGDPLEFKRFYRAVLSSVKNLVVC
ncbi:hypothetical protein SpCBS45565_g00636 [Spizellomyces sp. 'palustris']|nr:hypothetical protein SpCBS45565_g00636 [Spizellomyces sp. 'palustris']